MVWRRAGLRSGVQVRHEGWEEDWYQVQHGMEKRPMVPGKVMPVDFTPSWTCTNAVCDGATWEVVGRWLCLSNLTTTQLRMAVGVWDSKQSEFSLHGCISGPYRTILAHSCMRVRSGDPNRMVSPSMLRPRLLRIEAFLPFTGYKPKFGLDHEGVSCRFMLGTQVWSLCQ